MIEKKFSKRGDTCRVTFELPAETAETSLVVVGDFNDWDPSAHPMRRLKSRPVWKLALTLEAGRTYQFRYLADGHRWLNDPACDAEVPNPFGTSNCVLDLTGSGQ